MKKRNTKIDEISEFEAMKRLILAILYCDRSIPYSDYQASKNISTATDLIKFIKERGLI